MKGDNTIQLNQKTLCVALQYYFDNVLFKVGQAPAVLSVQTNGYSVASVNVNVKEQTEA